MKDVINIFVLNHGEFGEGLIKSAELITGKIEAITAFSLKKEMSLEDLIKEVEGKIKGIEGEVVLLTDMFGGTPNNVAMYLQQKYQCHVITGMNLPMLLELVLARENKSEDMESMIEHCVKVGQQAIKYQKICDVDEQFK